MNRRHGLSQYFDIPLCRDLLKKEDCYKSDDRYEQRLFVCSADYLQTLAGQEASNNFSMKELDDNPCIVDEFFQEMVEEIGDCVQNWYPNEWVYSYCEDGSIFVARGFGTIEEAQEKQLNIVE